jgi:hypothetical protein
MGLANKYIRETRRGIGRWSNFECLDQGQKSESAGSPLGRATALFEPRIYLEFMKSKPFASVALGMLPSGGASQQIRNWTGAREEPQPAALSQSEPPIFWRAPALPKP